MNLLPTFFGTKISFFAIATIASTTTSKAFLSSRRQARGAQMNLSPAFFFSEQKSLSLLLLLLPVLLQVKT